MLALAQPNSSLEIAPHYDCLICRGPETLTPLLERMQQHYHYPIYIVPALIIGLYLTYAGFTAPSKQS